MVHPAYESKTPIMHLVQLGEELAELIEQCAKAQKCLAKLMRFGLDGTNPLLPEGEPAVTNADALRGEMFDVEIRIGKVRELLDAERTCPKCASPIFYGYGLAGGGVGTYTTCTSELCDHFEKQQDDAEDP